MKQPLKLSGLRVGEHRQLHWSDVHIEQHKVNGEVQKLESINVRAETSKVRKSPTFFYHNGQYFKHLCDIAKPKSADELIFKVVGKNELSKLTLMYH